MLLNLPAASLPKSVYCWLIAFNVPIIKVFKAEIKMAALAAITICYVMIARMQLQGNLDNYFSQCERLFMSEYCLELPLLL